LREPLYAHEWAGFSENLRAIEETESEKTLPETFWEKFLPFWNASEKKLVISGRGQFEGKISRFLQKMNFTKIADAPANIKDPDCIRLHDVFLSEKLEALRPEILITFGEEVLSKKLKTFIRKNSPERHFHLSPAGYVPDTFGTLTDILRVEPEYFFGQLFKRQACGLSRDYFSAWQDYEQSSKAKLQAIFAENTWAEWRIANFIFEKTPEKAHLHLGNSMPVRYANIFDWGKKSVKIWANRGTSGIDGSTSTAVGHALFHSETTHYLWSGDVSFLYDRNAFWHEYLPQNLKIIVFNNAGGGIFKMIDGPKKWAECDEYFVTKQSKTARKTAEEHDFDYFEVRNFDELQKASDVFFSSEKRCIMEIFTDLHENTRFYERVMS
jgi:2-succinyl-5-enolpyruvyl-6-hydroxy-3-cyclohexene-1-carboxylate synthase